MRNFEYSIFWWKAWLLIVEKCSWAVYWQMVLPGDMDTRCDTAQIMNKIGRISLPPGRLTPFTNGCAVLLTCIVCVTDNQHAYGAREYLCMIVHHGRFQSSPSLSLYFPSVTISWAILSDSTTTNTSINFGKNDCNLEDVYTVCYIYKGRGAQRGSLLYHIHPCFASQRCRQEEGAFVGEGAGDGLAI